LNAAKTPVKGTLIITGQNRNPPDARETQPRWFDNNVPAHCMTGYVAGNSSSESITIKAVILKDDGTTGATLQSIVLHPGQQKAQFVFQDPAAHRKFKGQVVFVDQNGKQFTVTALTQKQNIPMAIPVVPTKPSGMN
jgi:hypothetical protein